ncbi:hypothetical protein BC834DRAFT_330211 [Gloeopeniophorella convolvens]|nr:hypothetical protein BC834DRAFT_330211 [Gloeopeniophorella convolvens]
MRATAPARTACWPAYPKAQDARPRCARPQPCSYNAPQPELQYSPPQAHYPHPHVLPSPPPTTPPTPPTPTRRARRTVFAQDIVMRVLIGSQLDTTTAS